jgi:Phasin protein
VAKDRMDFEHPDPMQAASFGANWMTNVTEHNLRQTMSTFEGTLTMLRKTAEAFGQQASVIREHSAALAQEAMGNAAEFGNRIVRIKDPLEWAEVQSDFLSKQAQLFAEGQRKLGEELIQESNDMAKNALHQTRDMGRKRSKAA